MTAALNSGEPDSLDAAIDKIAQRIAFVFDKRSYAQPYTGRQEDQRLARPLNVHEDYLYARAAERAAHLVRAASRAPGARLRVHRDCSPASPCAACRKPRKRPAAAAPRCVKLPPAHSAACRAGRGLDPCASVKCAACKRTPPALPSYRPLGRITEHYTALGSTAAVTRGWKPYTASRELDSQLGLI